MMPNMMGTLYRFSVLMCFRMGPPASIIFNVVSPRRQLYRSNMPLFSWAGRSEINFSINDDGIK